MTTKKYEIVLQYIQDLSVEVPNPETYVYSREYITKYTLSININTKTLQNKMLEVITKLTYKDLKNNKRKSNFEVAFSTVIKLLENNIEKKELEKIILCDLQNEIYPRNSKIFTNLIRETGFPELDFEKKIDFDDLYNKRKN
tara:strand:+ start:430 stop:855 length:426 start_codon:yes stop_codon:yes gene_type:complete